MANMANASVLAQSPAKPAGTSMSPLPSPSLSSSSSLASRQSLGKSVLPPEEPSSDSNLEDDPLIADQDAAQSLFQPALSPAATRLTSVKTPAAEKAAAMEKISGGGFFSMFDGIDSDGVPPRKLTKAQPNRPSRALTLGQPPHRYEPLPKLPAPWHAGPKQLIVLDEPTAKPALSGVFGGSGRRRSSSGSAETFKKLKDALPSISFSSNFMSSLRSPLFFSDSSSPKNPNAEAKQMSIPDIGDSGHITAGNTDGGNGNMTGSPGNAASRPPSAKRDQARTIRRSTSDDSMLYHSLSRVSSLGDDDRWGAVSEMANVRFKAIKESFDRPTFKLPQLPQALKRHAPPTTEPSHHDGLPVPPASRPAGSCAKDGTLSELDRALEMLTGDVVVMGGYRGSILRSTKTNRQIWVPVKVGLNIRKVDLEVGLEPEDEETMEETVYPSGMLTHIGPVDISRRLFKRLRMCKNAKSGRLRVWDYGWDWRLSPHILSRKLIAYLEQLPSSRADKPGERGVTVIAHSLGGVITRHAMNQRPDLFAGVVFAGTPQRCINILGPVRNGDAVLLNEKVLTAKVNFSLRTTFVFLPEDGFCFINKNTGEEFPIDLYSAEEWAKHALSPCVGPILPPYHTRPNTALGSLLSFSNSLPNLPMRSRNSSIASELGTRAPIKQQAVDIARRTEESNDHTLAPQMGGGTSSKTRFTQQREAEPKDMKERERYMKYLERTLADTKRFRTELQHQTKLTQSNLYPPMAVIYGKEIPTVYGAHVTCRDQIQCADAYDDLLFRSGDGVVLAKEAMLPPGYDVVNGGRISTDRGHITMLGDMAAVGKALLAVLRGRQKGIGTGSV